jgi:hypothetical protein
MAKSRRRIMISYLAREGHEEEGYLYIKPEQHDVAVLDQIVLAL